MSEEKRKLAAILFADIKGYTEMMQNDEELGFDIVGKFKKVVERETENHSGEVISFYGDGVLALFDSAIDAVNCSLALQREFREDPVVPVRIGLNDGDVLLRDDNAFGDSINLASRIESIGIPGSILFSHSIYNKVCNKKEFEIKLIGSFHFKNVKEEMKVFALTNEDLPVPKKSEITGKLKEKKSLGLKKLILMVIGVSILSILVAVQFFEKDLSPIESYLITWGGNWRQELEVDQGQTLGGTVSLREQDGAMSGTARNEYTEVLFTENELYDIMILEDGKILSGKWKSIELPDTHGKFELTISSDEESFSGYYSMTGDTARFLWNGYRK